MCMLIYKAVGWTDYKDYLIWNWIFSYLTLGRSIITNWKQRVPDVMKHAPEFGCIYEIVISVSGIWLACANEALKGNYRIRTER